MGELKEEIDDLKLEGRRRNMYVEGLQQEKDEAIENMNKLKFEIEKVKTELSEKESELSDIQKECDLLKEKTSDNEKFAKHFREDLSEQLETCKSELDKVERKLQVMTTKNNTLQQQICSLQFCENPQFLQRKTLLEENAENMTEFEKQFLLACDELRKWQEKSSDFEESVKKLGMCLADKQVEVEQAIKQLQIEVENKNGEKKKIGEQKKKKKKKKKK